MIALDTNVLLRYLLDDDAAQSSRAAALLQQHDAVLVTDVVLAETVWTLKGRKYRVDDPGIATVVNALCSEPNIRFEDGEVVWRALTDFTAAIGANSSSGKRASGKRARSKPLDFADALIVNKARRCARDAGQVLDAVYSFDAAVSKLEGARRP